jgi:hypothetical protein
VIKQKKNSEDLSSEFFFQFRLCLLGCIYGAGTSASAAVDAVVSIDNVLAVSFRDSTNGAVSCASTACDASITNYICHKFILLEILHLA